MLCIEAKYASHAWKECFLELYKNGKEIPENDFYKNESVAIEILDVATNLYDSSFPMTEQEIQVINNFLVTGQSAASVSHEWTKIYRERLFDENSPINNVIQYLKEDLNGKRAQVSLWDSSKDLDVLIAPCFQVLWFKVISNKLEIHVHMRATDCYKKLLMNINEFIVVQPTFRR